MAAVLVYDGDCGVCTKLSHWADPKLPDDVEVRPSFDVDLEALGLTVDDVLRAAWWVEGDERLEGHLAVSRAWQEMGGLWRVPAWLARTPPTAWLADRIYRWIARNRDRLPGSTDACRIDAPH